ncbi:MAG: 4-hydroxy-3-methylbut-2-enyl diphosphate reductase [Succinivibrionaceae bacterium]|nr:4-hydroxy-3-methylbut-2-enyl diphosphate reductase [Succinivibrionaceae bacterium]
MDNKIYLVNPRGFCAGVSRAISIVDTALERFGAPVYVRHEVVHNRYVVDSLRRKGAVFIEDLAEVPDGAILIFSAHGVPMSVEAEAKNRNLTVFDATCPLVSKVHVEVRALSKRGAEVIMIGHRFHPEVEATLGQYDNPDGGIYLVENAQDADRLQIRDPNNLYYVTQTTLSITESKTLVEHLRSLYPQIRGPRKNDICYATQNRQDAVRSLAHKVDLFIVVGSTSSSNSNRLRELAESCGCRAYLVDDESQLDEAWFAGGIGSIGVTAGASAPDILIERVVERLKAVTGYRPEEMPGIEEKRNFEIPKDLQRSL